MAQIGAAAATQHRDPGQPRQQSPVVVGQFMRIAGIEVLGCIEFGMAASGRIGAQPRVSPLGSRPSVSSVNEITTGTSERDAAAVMPIASPPWSRRSSCSSATACRFASASSSRSSPRALAKAGFPRQLQIGPEGVAQNLPAAFASQQVEGGELRQIDAVVKDEGGFESAVAEQRNSLQLGQGGHGSGHHHDRTGCGQSAE
jgi:hypothetical protein